jgi:secreted Zn-dependent insulinase-like peptidase
MFFNVGKIDYKNLKFDIYEYFMYLFYSKSLNNIFINNYVVDYSIENYIEIENNNVIAIIITLTKMGVEKLDEVLLIIYKYIEIIKKNGYDNKLFKDFIKYKKNKQILQFNKNKFVDISKDFLSDIIRNYRLFGVEQIFAFGTPKEENYNEENLKTFFNQFQYERSFFGANINTTVRDFKDKTFLESPIIKVYQYYKKEYLYGKIPEDLLNKIDDSNYDIENLNIRESNKYLSEKYENAIP